MKKRNTVIAVDPGLTIGVAVVKIYPESPVGFDVCALHTYQYHQRFDLCEWIKTWEPYLAALVVEDFQLYASKAESQIGSSFETVRVIGQLELTMYQIGLLSLFHLQKAIEIDRVQIPPTHQVEPMLKNVHCSDAYKHGRLFLLTRKLVPLRQALARKDTA